MRAEHTLAQLVAEKEHSLLQTLEHCFLTKSANCRSRFRPNSSVSFKKVHINPSAEMSGVRLHSD
jgi:hypothetical protein